MRKILAIAVLASGLMIPLATPSAARVLPPGLECDAQSIEAMMCGGDYDVEMSVCDLSPPGQVSACQGRALSKYVRCMTSC